MIRNKYKIIAMRSVIICGIIAIALFIIPSLTEMDNMDAFPIYIFALFSCTAGIVLYYFYNKNAHVFNSLLQPQNIIARWFVGQNEYAQLQQLNVKQISGNFLLMRWVVVAVSFIIGIFLAFMGLEITFILIFFVGLSAFTWIVSAIAINSQKQQLQPTDAQVILTKDGGFINDTMHVWSKLDNRLENAAINKIKSGIHYLEINYSVPSKGARVETTARFPIPDDKLTEAQYVLDEILKSQ